MNSCWMCKEIKSKDGYIMKSTKGNTRLYIGKPGKHYIIKANGEDVLEQEIVYCPLCGTKLD